MSDQTPTGDPKPTSDVESTVPIQAAQPSATDETTVMEGPPGPPAQPAARPPRSFGAGVLGVVAGLALLIGVGVGVVATNLYTDDDQHPRWGDRDWTDRDGLGGWRDRWRDGPGDGWVHECPDGGWALGPGGCWHKDRGAQDGWRDQAPPWGQDSYGGTGGRS